MPFKTAHEQSTIRQIDAKAVLFQSVFGINADFPFCSLHFIHHQNPGIIAAARQSRAMFSAWWMFDGLSVMTLRSC